MDGEHSPLQIPSKVHSVSRVLTISLHEREKYFSFDQRNNTTKGVAEKAELSMNLVEKRTQWVTKMFASKEYFSCLFA